MTISVSEQRFWGKTDSETIQNTIDYAEKNGENSVVIPYKNARTGESIYIIDKCIHLPSCMTVELDGCHLRLADDVRENIFRNRNVEDPSTYNLAGEQHDIRLIGRNGAMLDGGKHNGLVEQVCRDNPEKNLSMYVNLLVFFQNVRNFEIRGIHVKDSRWWSYCFIFCRWGTLADLSFDMHATVENQDGIDLRVGCEYFTIENITGITGDDTIALTSLPLNKNEQQYKVEGKGVDTHDITIRNVISSSHGCSLVRFLCEDGAKEYNITVDGLKDTGEALSSASMLIGSSGTRFVKDHAHVKEDFRNIVIRNITTCAQRGITLSEPCENLVIENLTTYGRNEVGFAIMDNFECDNFVVRNFTFDSNPEEADCVFEVSEQALENMRDYRITHARAKSAKYLYRRSIPQIDDLKYDMPFEAVFTEEKPKLAMSYGRYHRYFYGKEIENRPKDNRFTGKM